LCEKYFSPIFVARLLGQAPPGEGAPSSDARPGEGHKVKRLWKKNLWYTSPDPLAQVTLSRCTNTLRTLDNTA
jgi:hypothetical protein